MPLKGVTGFVVKTNAGDYRFKDRISTMDRIDLMEIYGKLDFAKKFITKNDENGKPILDIKGIESKELINDQKNMIILYADILNVLSFDENHPDWLRDIDEDSLTQIIQDKRIADILVKQLGG